MDPLTLGLIGGGVGLVGGLASSAIQGIFNSGQAQEQRDYETNMANTTYQRGEADLKAAGLNPVLAAGGATDPTPSVSAATISAPDLSGDVYQGFSSGVSAASAEQSYNQSKVSFPVSLQTLKQNLDNAEFNGNLTEAQTDLIYQNMAQVEASTDLTDAQKDQVIQGTQNMVLTAQGLKLANTAAAYDNVSKRLEAIADGLAVNHVVPEYIRSIENTLLGGIKIFK